LKVLFLTNVPSPYIVDFLNEFGKLCELTVIFEKRKSDERDKSWQNFQFKAFKGIILKGIRIATDMAFCPHIIKHLNKSRYDHIIVANPMTPTGMIAILYMKILRIPYIISSEGGFAKSGKGLKERLKRTIISGANAYLSTTGINDKYFLKYGARQDRIYKFPFTSLYHNEIEKHPSDKAEKEILKKEFGILEDKIIMSVGRSLHIKGIDVLLKACININKTIGVYIIGDMPTADYIEITEKNNLCNVHFVNFMNRKDLKKYYRVAELYAMPTRGDTWGLAIIEAMANGLPVVTSDRCVAGVELIRNYENGFVVPADDDKILAEKINILLANDKLRNQMAINNLEKMQWYSFENMASRHLDILNNINY